MSVNTINRVCTQSEMKLTFRLVTVWLIHPKARRVSAPTWTMGSDSAATVSTGLRILWNHCLFKVLDYSFSWFVWSGCTMTLTVWDDVMDHRTNQCQTLAVLRLHCCQLRSPTQTLTWFQGDLRDLFDRPKMVCNPNMRHFNENEPWRNQCGMPLSKNEWNEIYTGQM